ncbi:DUF5358 family protein [Avibacterium paragallinarum]|uniref:DUF5358 family protein n=1 Tax=Avibacterium paragallinarum TaxID=728 RepID=UPI00397BCE6B
MKKYLLLSLSIAILAGCASPKYKISDQDLNRWIGTANDIEQCINPNLTNQAAYSLLSKDEYRLLVQYAQDTLKEMIGSYNYNIMRNDAESYAYYLKRSNELNNNIKGNYLTTEQCQGFKTKFQNDLANIKAERYAQEQAKIRQEQEKLRKEEERRRQIQNAPKPKRQTTVNCTNGTLLFDHRNCVITEY